MNEETEEESSTTEEPSFIYDYDPEDFKGEDVGLLIANLLLPSAELALVVPAPTDAGDDWMSPVYLGTPTRKWLAELLMALHLGMGVQIWPERAAPKPAAESE